MDRAMIKVMPIAAVALLFCSLLELKASGKEKPLLKVHESIGEGFGRMGMRQNYFLEVTQSGRISLKRGTKVMLSAAELQALRNFLDSASVRDLHDSYVDRFGFCSDCGAHSMKIEMTLRGETKRISLNWRMARSFKNYPVPLDDLVCKIYGLEKRVDGHKSFDTCDAACLDLVLKPAP